MNLRNEKSSFWRLSLRDVKMFQKSQVSLMKKEELEETIDISSMSCKNSTSKENNNCLSFGKGLKTERYGKDQTIT